MKDLIVKRLVGLVFFLLLFIIFLPALFKAEGVKDIQKISLEEISSSIIEDINKEVKRVLPLEEIYVESIKNRLRGNHKVIIGGNIGKNKNENGSAQVIEYSRDQIKKIGVYDGENLIQSSE